MHLDCEDENDRDTMRHSGLWDLLIVLVSTNNLSDVTVVYDEQYYGEC